MFYQVEVCIGAHNVLGTSSARNIMGVVRTGYQCTFSLRLEKKAHIVCCSHQNRFRIACVRVSALSVCPVLHLKHFGRTLRRNLNNFLKFYSKCVDFRKSSMLVRCRAQALVFWHKMRKDLESEMSLLPTLMWTVRAPYRVLGARTLPSWSLYWCP